MFVSNKEQLLQEYWGRTRLAESNSVNLTSKGIEKRELKSLSKLELY